MIKNLQSFIQKQTLTEYGFDILEVLLKVKI